MNDVRIQEQMYITLKLEDKLRFGYDILSLFLLLFETHNGVVVVVVHNCDSVPGRSIHTYTLFLTRLSHIPTCSRL